MKKVLRSDGLIYPSIVIAAKEMRYSYSNICDAIKRGRAMRNGYALKFYNGDASPFTPLPRTYSNLHKAVIRSDGKIYASMTEAAKDMNCDLGHLSRCVNGKVNSVAGYGWRVYDGENNSPFGVKLWRNKILRSDGKIYPSTAFAAKDMGCSISSIYKYAKNGYAMKNGYALKHYDGDDSPFTPIPKPKIHSPKCKAVVRSDGRIFDSILQAASETGCFSTGIHACLKGRTKTSGGYGWKYLRNDN